jgi:hypothetical protein
MKRSALVNRILRRGQRGQMLIIFAMLIVPVSFAVGAIAVDASMWQSERRGAQKDADLSALAGAFQLLDPNATGALAINAAEQNRKTNDEAGNASAIAITAGTDCETTGDPPNHVKVDVRHASHTFFATLFGLNIAPDIGAHACARAGSVTGMSGIVPFQIDTQTAPCYVAGKPQFGTLCGMEFGSNNDPNAPNPRGLLDLDASGGHCSDAPGSGDPYAMITNGASGHCIINTKTPLSCDPIKNGPWDDCVAVQAGNTKKVLDAVKARIAREGACDTNRDGIESFDEVVRLVYDNADLSKRIYEPIDCDPNTDGVQVSPRLITIIVLNGPPTAGNDGNPIVGFAGFYLAGCSSTEGLTSDSQLTFDEKKCNVPGAQVAPIVSSGASFVSLHLQQPCGNGPNPTPCPTHTPAPPPTNTPTPTPVPPTPPPTDTPLPHGGGQCGQGNQDTCTPTPAPTDTPLGNTETPTNTPGGPTPTATPHDTPGHDIVYGDFVNLIVTNGDIGDFDPNTTLTGVTLVQ